jgi:hypothetical protein
MYKQTVTDFIVYLGMILQFVRKVAVHLGYGTARYVDLVVSIEVAVEVCCCFTVFSC